MANRQRPFIVAIDGPAGSGKTTIARALSGRLGFAHVDTGAIYRAVALLAERLHVGLENEDALVGCLADLRISFTFGEERSRVFLGEEDVSEDIRRHEISSAASRLGTWPKVRAGLLDLQRRLALESSAPGAVLEGRDIGTVVFPDADVKLFLTATPAERARRRHEELTKKGLDVSFEKVAADQAHRDDQDSTREVAPLAPAPDAIVFDSTGMDVREVIDRLENMVRESTSRDFPAF